LWLQIDQSRILKKTTFSFERRGDLALVMMYGEPASCRCAFATKLYFSRFRSLDPNSIMFVNFEPPTGRITLDRLRWSDRLWSYIYLESVTLSDELTEALGLASSGWRRAIARSRDPERNGIMIKA
jgi:hypothetical protein